MDSIKKKLQLIDFELDSSLNLLKKLAVKSPLFFCAIGLISGIMLEEYLSLTSLIFLVVTIASTAFTIVFFIFRKADFSPFFFAVAVTAGFLGLGGVRLNAFYQPAGNDIRHLVGSERKLATIRGMILNKPRIYRNNDWEFSKFSHSDPSSSFYLDLEQVETINSWSNVSGTIRVQVFEPVMDLKVGDYIEAYCWLSRFKEPSNPGQFDFARYLQNRGIYIGASIDSRDAISTLNKESSFFIKLKNKFSEKASIALLSDASLQERNKELLEALLLGYRGNIDSETYLAFKSTGLLHFISLSGMHLGILVSFIWWLCRIAGLLKRARSVICIIALCVFLMIVPPRAPTLRAAIICFVFCLSFLFRRRTNHLNNLSLAAIVLLLMRPTGLFEAGWQLSFASVLGILIFTDRIYFFTYENVTRWSFFKTTKKRNLLIRLASKAADYSLALLCVGLAAWLGGAGILLYHFYTINPLTSLWTVIVFPLVVLILAFGYLKIIMSFLLPTLSYFLGIMVNDISALMLWIVNFIASLNLSEILIGHIPVIVVIIYYCLLIFIVFGHIRRLFIKQAVYSASVLVLLLVLGGLKWQRSYRQNLVLTALDVGHGQAIVIQLPNSKNLLFDTGSLYIKDVGQRIVVPFLQYSGINSIDAIVISHNDIDHINGIPEIARSWDVRHIYAASTFFQDYDKWGTSRFLKSSVAESGLDIKRLPDELRVKGTDKINFIWPNEQALKAQYLSENDKSLVSLIEFGNSRILLCSDIEKTAQKRILQLYPDLRCEVMVVPHHGSINTLDENFTDKLDGQIYICICDHRQFERLQEKSQGNKTGWFYTARDGAIKLTVSAKGDISAVRSRQEKTTDRK